MKNLLPLALLTALAGCHGVQYPPTSPSPPARVQAAVCLNLVSNPAELPMGGGSAIVRVEALGSDGLGVSTPVRLSVSEGELGTGQVTTDSTGHATASWNGTKTATLTGIAGDVTTIASIRVLEPIVFPPNPPPPPPIPTPEPGPLPPTPPSLSLTLTASPLQVATGAPVTLAGSVANLNAGESVIAYEWDWEGDKITDETTVSASRDHVYATDGIKAPIVRILTSSGRATSATGRIIVFRP